MHKVIHSTFLTLLFFSALVSGCKKDNRLLGVEVQPGEDELNLSHLRDLPVYAHTIASDSTISLNLSGKFIGSNEDAAAGRTDIGLYLTPGLNVTDLNFGASATLTSAEIILAINTADYVGELGSVLSWSVYPVDSVLNPSRGYFTNKKDLHDPGQLIGTGTSSYQTVNNSPVLKIPIDGIYANSILMNPQYLTNNETFRAQYKGLYVVAQKTSGEGVIFRTEVDNSLSGLYLYYKHNSDSIQSFRFPFSGSTSVKFNTVTFKPTTNLDLQLKGDTSLGASFLVLKGMGLTRLKVQLPAIKNYGDTFDISVNRAEVIFYLDQSLALGSGRYVPPSRISLLPMDSLGREIISADQLGTTNLARYDGYYDVTSRRYVFNIAKYAQEIFNGRRKNYGFYLVMASPEFPQTLRRDTYVETVVLEGSAHPQFRPVLNLSYVKL
jgi:hypothetical protein